MGSRCRPLATLLVTVIVQLPIDVISDEPTWSCYEQTGGCYYIPDFYGPQFEASCLCRSFGGQLIKLDSATELSVVGGLMQNEDRTEGFWLGATNKKNEKHYLWEDGTNAEMIPWHIGEPNLPSVEYCIFVVNETWFLTTPVALGDFWAFDVSCGWSAHAVCEKGVKSTREWSVMSRDEIYPSARMESYSGLSSLECADKCTRNCCFSIAYKQDGSNCILYREHFRLLTSSQAAPGYVNFD